MLILGTDRRSISPPSTEGLTMDGMPRRHPTLGILDDLEINLLLLQDAGKSVVICLLDWLFVRQAEFTAYENILQDLIPGAELMLCATHSHSSKPIPFGEPSPEAISRCEAAGTTLREAFAASLASALSARVEVEVASARIPFLPAPGGNRRVKLGNGSCVSAFGAGPILPPGHKLAGFGGPDAEAIDVLAFRKPGSVNPLALITGYSSHIHFYEIPYFTGEAAGAARLALRRALPEVHPFYAVSFPGDVAQQLCQPIPHDDEAARTRWQQESAQTFGLSFAQAVCPGLENLEYAPTKKLNFIRHQESSGHNEEFLLVETLQIGPHAVCSVPGEMFVDWEQAIRANLPCASLLALGYNASWLGYVATPLAFEEGSYEVMRGPVDVLGYPTPATRAKSSTQTGFQIIEIAKNQMAQLFPSTPTK